MVAIGIDRILNRAANWLEQHDLHKHALGRYEHDAIEYDPDRPRSERVVACCALGAIAVASDHLHTLSAAFLEAGLALAESLELGDGPDGAFNDDGEIYDDATEDVYDWLCEAVGDWNDNAQRTKDDVVAALRRAAKDVQRLSFQ